MHKRAEEFLHTVLQKKGPNSLTSALQQRHKRLSEVHAMDPSRVSSPMRPMSSKGFRASALLSSLASPGTPPPGLSLFFFFPLYFLFIWTTCVFLLSISFDQAQEGSTENKVTFPRVDDEQ